MRGKVQWERRKGGTRVAGPYVIEKIARRDDPPYRWRANGPELDMKSNRLRHAKRAVVKAANLSGWDHTLQVKVGYSRAGIPQMYDRPSGRG
jgi:hypothetical protein